MYRKSALWILVGLLVAGAADAVAQGRGQGKGKAKGDDAPKAASVNASGLDANEVRIIREWFGNSTNIKGLPPGLAKKEQLPPGLQRQLARNGKLPPGLEKKIHPLPRDLELRLPRLPDGRKRIFLAGNVIILDERTSTIVDVLQQVF